MIKERQLLSGDEAVALAAKHAGVRLGAGYPGTPSTEILEAFNRLGGCAQWSPNEKVALEVGIGAAFAGARTLITMKHVGLNVAADPLFTAAYTDIEGGLVVVSADDPGMASSQNEQDNRHYARAAALPMLEPIDSQQSYDFTWLAFEISERWKIPVILRMTTRVCHAKTVMSARTDRFVSPTPTFRRDLATRVMVPDYAKPAHQRLRQKLVEIAEWNEAEGPIKRYDGHNDLGIVSTGIAAMHSLEASPEASHLVIGLTYPLPISRIRNFADSMNRVMVIEEGDPVLADSLRSANIPVESKPDMYRFGELNVNRVRRILTNDTRVETTPPKGKPPALCQGCSYHGVFAPLRDLGCIVAGDIGCYTLGSLPPFSAIDICICMGASIGVGLGLRHVLPEEQARRVISVIGDSTFVHSGITGLAEMVYNPPATGHVVLLLDNGTTAMTGQQEHPGTGRQLDHSATGKINFEEIGRAMGIQNVHVVSETPLIKPLIEKSLALSETSLIIIRQPCVLSAPKVRFYDKAISQ